MLLTSFCLSNSKKTGRQDSKIKPPSSTIYPKNNISRKNSIFQKFSLTSFCKITAEYRTISPEKHDSSREERMNCLPEGDWAVAESQRGLTQDEIKIVCEVVTPWKTGIFLRGRFEFFSGRWVSYCWVPKRDDVGWNKNCMLMCNVLKNGYLPERKGWALCRRVIELLLSPKEGWRRMAWKLYAKLQRRKNRAYSWEEGLSFLPNGEWAGAEFQKGMAQRKLLIMSRVSCSDRLFIKHLISKKKKKEWKKKRTVLFPLLIRFTLQWFFLIFFSWFVKQHGIHDIKVTDNSRPILRRWTVNCIYELYCKLITWWRKICLLI